MGQGSTVEVSKTKYKIITLNTLLLIIGAIALIFAGLCLSGYAYIGFKNSYNKPVLTASVCGNSVVERVNKYYSNETSDTDSRAAIIADIKKLKHFDKDPTCLMIIISAASSSYSDSQLDELKQYVTKLQQLAEKGVYPNNRVKSYMSMQDINGLEGITSGSAN